jgi:hypothetical protein
MSNAFEISTRYMNAALEAGAETKIPADIIARAMLDRVLEVYRAGRSLEDIASELGFHIDNLDPEGDHNFMRP